ncbi:MAG TPA: hypothetical protein VN634_06785 [Candidatus Limnocylindrales bacterium]|nr:hypothetical protein [Candidatus Limnocylindrales bacterium]
MDDNRIRPGVWLAVVGSLGVLILVLSLLGGGRRSAVAPAPPETAAIPAKPDSAPVASGQRSHAASRSAPAPAAVEQPEYIDGLVYGDIDLREAKALMPDNLYWQLGAPTKDPEVLAKRDEERKKRNEEYGRVLAGDANEDEVKAYYDYKTKLSSDYLEFAEFMSRRYRNSDNKEFVGMLELATKMHADRLKMLPGEMEDALERSREREKAREDWKRQQDEFGAAGRIPNDDEEE